MTRKARIITPDDPSFFKVLSADPPWRFGDKLPGKSRGAAKNYKTLSVEEICKFGLPPLSSDCVLFLWRVSAMQEEALKVCRAWGFIPYAELVWQKRTKHGKKHFGMGRIVRASHETCLIGVREKRPKVKKKNVRSTFDAPVGRHSQKPEAFYDLIESLFDGPYVELFARRHRPGWVCFGNELPPSVAA